MGPTRARGRRAALAGCRTAEGAQQPAAATVPPAPRRRLRHRRGRLPRSRSRDGVDHDVASACAVRLAQDPSAAAGELLGAFGYEDCEELEDWVRSARERFRCSGAMHSRRPRRDEEASGHVARALVFAERLVAEDPLSEQAHRLLMRLHYRRGDRSAALAAYARCGRCCATNWRGAERRDARARATDRTLGRVAGRPRRGPMPAAIARPPLLVGRERQWRALEDAWEQRRVAVLIGDAGMGKTRLLGDFRAVARYSVDRCASRR